MEEKIDYVICKECGGEVFEMKHKLIKIDKFRSETGREEIMDFPVYVCASCDTLINLEEEVNDDRLILTD